MRRALGVAALLGVIVWSAVAWGGSALLGAADGMFGAGSSLAASYPDLMAWFAPLFSFFAGVGSAGVVVIWLLGLAAIAVLYLIGRFALSGLPTLFNGDDQEAYDYRGAHARRARSYRYDERGDYDNDIRRYPRHPARRRRSRRDWDDDDDDD